MTSQDARGDKAVALLRHLRGCVENPDAHMRLLCRAAGLKWEPSELAEGEVLSGKVDGVSIVVSRKEWLPLNEDQGMDLLASKLKEALP
jgi:hypothetical protein